ncbi:short-chain dehydrogenase/reductase SDR [Kribbella flavida DSM 17836]|uniref:Short-chain dehydrogenase/reductase SDR n=1 Tax=Kribbella flavida (strain DSM 17836 / JCM 10339 / NBRC 14399) TaxID=479435 RepID=D2PUW1_KRIFD|nr:SDR family oxidoreductase [Kribbella flavida]ADB31427.1 short-chain dehydrogenase/reductase SDR [Kribbella flavida DSM 17836]
MLLENKTAIVYGGGGAMGGAFARAFAAEGARVYLAGRTAAKLERVAADITAAGGWASTAVVDAYDAESVAGHVASVEGPIDICCNAVSVRETQDVALTAMSVEDFVRPVEDAARTNFVTATAAARRMTAQGSGVILMLSSSAARESGFEMGGFSLACAAIECLTRSLAGEIGKYGVRVVALRPNFTPQTHPEWVNPDDGSLQHLIDGTALGRLPELNEVARTAAFAVSDHAGAMTGAVLNLTCGAIVD